MGRKTFISYCRQRGLDTTALVRVASGILDRKVERTDVLDPSEVVRLDRVLDLPPEPSSEPAAGGTAPIEERVELLRDPIVVGARNPRQVGYSVFFHFDDVFEEIRDREAIARRLSLVLRHLKAHGRTSIVKGTRHRINHGWRRTPLGGGGGCQFYLWWAPKGAPPLADLEAEMPDQSIVVRAIRHHDDHAPLFGGRWDDYVPLDLDILLDASLGGSPWTAEQERFISDDAHIRVLMGSAGTGKTSALAELLCRRLDGHALFVTYSEALVEHCRDYLATFACTEIVESLTFRDLVCRMLGLPPTQLGRPDVDLFVGEVERLGSALLGPWSRHLDWLSGELRAYLVGAALPFEVEGLPWSRSEHLEQREYRALRSDELGSEAVEAALRVTKVLASRGKLGTLFPEVSLARRALLTLRQGLTALEVGGAWSAIERLVIDEVQDLTLIEIALVVELAAAIGKARGGVPPFLAFAGDEGQTVRPTGFHWSWVGRLLEARFGAYSKEKGFRSNVRSPGVIGELVNASRRLYGLLEDEVSPRGSQAVEVLAPTSEHVFHCEAGDEAELDGLMTVLARQERTAIITLSGERPDFLSEEVDLLSPEQVKGLDFQTVCLLDPGAWLATIDDHDDHHWRRDERLMPLRKRSAIDRFRVALSRATETLVLLDFRPRPSAAAAVEALLDFEPVACAPDELPVPRAFSPPELAEQLDDQDRSRDERVHGFLSDARLLGEFEPEMALRKARQARSLLGRRNTPGSVIDPTLREETVAVLARLACEQALRRVERSPEEASALLNEAQRAARAGGDEPLARYLRVLQRAGDSGAIRQRARAIRDLLRLASSVETEPPPWLRAALAPPLYRWLNDFVTSIASASEPLEDVELLSTAYLLAGYPPEAVDDLLSITLAEVARGLVDRRRYREALEVAGRADVPTADIEALCHERQRRHEAAASCYLEAGMLDDALRCVRSRGNHMAALEILEQLGDHEAGPALRWLVRVLEVIEAIPARQLDDLWLDEQRLLRQTFVEARRLTSTARSSGGEDAPLPTAIEYVGRKLSDQRGEDETSVPLEVGGLRCRVAAELEPDDPARPVLSWLDGLLRTLASCPNDASRLLVPAEKRQLTAALADLRQQVGLDRRSTAPPLA